MKEVYIAPLTIEGNFHIGREMAVIAADTYVRWQFLNRNSDGISFIHDSWNTYGPERSRESYLQRENLIFLHKKVKDKLAVLPSAELQIKDEKIEIHKKQEFRDDDPENVDIVNDYLSRMKKKGIVITGIIEGKKGLYLDIERILETTDIDEDLDGIQIYPQGYKARFKKTLDPSNKSNYIGKIPITKSRSFGLAINLDLLEGDSYYTDTRFSPQKKAPSEDNSRDKICISPLILLGLMPYIRNQISSDDVISDFISNGVGSSVRFNLVSVLLNIAAGVKPYNNIHLFGKLDVAHPGREQILNDEEWSSKIRYIFFDQLSSEHKIINQEYAHNDDISGINITPDFEFFKKKVNLLKALSNHKNESEIPYLSIDEKRYLQNLGISIAMDQLDYAKAFKKIKYELYKRCREAKKGISPYDSTLINIIHLFFPEI